MFFHPIPMINSLYTGSKTIIKEFNNTGETNLGVVAKAESKIGS